LLNLFLSLTLGSVTDCLNNFLIWYRYGFDSIQHFGLIVKALFAPHFVLQKDLDSSDGFKLQITLLARLIVIKASCAVKATNAVSLTETSLLLRGVLVSINLKAQSIFCHKVFVLKLLSKGLTPSRSGKR
jgi:hypothetical protein